MRKIRRLERGFTLVELLVVTLIIGILAALLLPTLSRSKAQAHSTTCKNHLHQMGLALQLYVNDNQGQYPYLRGSRDPTDDALVGAANTGFWYAKLVRYYPLNWTNPAYQCPGYKGAMMGEFQGLSPLGSYAYNALGVRLPFSGFEDLGIYYPPGEQFGLGGIPVARPPPLFRFRATTESDIKVPSEMLSIGESRFLSAQMNKNPGGYFLMTCGILKWDDPPHNYTTALWAFDPARHGKNYNQLFCDGHVAAMSPWVLFNPTNTAAMWNYDHQPHPEFWSPY
jgi:prepilin-type N-terminal cleavage/methylation domain-containing protein/prepilin-type processing-associated H-X9-DG protein